MFVVFSGLLFAIAGWIFVERSGALGETVVLRQLDVRAGDDVHIDFEFVNNSRSPIVCPNGWHRVFEDGTSDGLPITRDRAVKVSPGEIRIVSIPIPAGTNRWRLKADFYKEGAVSNLKFDIKTSSWDEWIPSFITNLKMHGVMSDWVTQ